MSLSDAERQRRHRFHRRGDHSLCSHPEGQAPSLAGLAPQPSGYPHVVYRFFGAAGELLYIGMTLDPTTRFNSHRGEKPWWSDVARIEIEQHPDRVSAEAAERAAIRAERPIWNVTHNAVNTVVQGLRITPPTRRVVTISAGGVDVRIESDERPEALSSVVAAIAGALRTR